MIRTNSELLLDLLNLHSEGLTRHWFSRIILILSRFIQDFSRFLCFDFFTSQCSSLIQSTLISQYFGTLLKNQLRLSWECWDNGEKRNRQGLAFCISIRSVQNKVKLCRIFVNWVSSTQYSTLTSWTWIFISKKKPHKSQKSKSLILFSLKASSWHK